MSGLFSKLTLRIWLFLPSYVRLFAYKILVRIGIRLYGSPTPSSRAYRLPFNFYAKFSFKVRESEADLIQFLYENTTIPVPRVIDCIRVPTGAFIVMTRLPGEILSDRFTRMTAEERTQLVQDLGSSLKQLHRITAPDSHISAFGGGPFMDWRISEEDLHGPFNSEREFYEHLYKRIPIEHHQRLRDLARGVHDVPHRICLTHNDLNPHSILIHNNRLSGLVDWEFAGWFPEWWEYTRSLCSRTRWEEWVDLMNEVHPEIYPKEMEMEMEFMKVTFIW